VKVRFLEIAEIELDQAIHWYRAQAPGLDNAFLVEVLSRQTASRAFLRLGIRAAKVFAAAVSAGSRTG
jgi:hypothetical protein